MKSIQMGFNYPEDEKKFIQGSVSSQGRKMNTMKGEGQKENRKTVFAGDSDFLLQNQIGQKKAKAQKDALKRIVEVFESDLKLDSMMENSALHRDEQMEQAKQYDAEMEKIDQAQLDLKEEYGITDDSEEEKNLNLIRKSLSNPLAITEKEMTQLEQMGPITEYQRASLEYDAMKNVWKELRDEAGRASINENQKIEGIRLARLKSDPMVGAQKEAQDIMDEASDAIIALLREDAKDKLDEKFGKTEETEDKNAEEGEKTEEKDKKDKSDADVLADQLDAEQLDVLERIKKFIKNQGILQEDTLGLKIDELL